MSVIFALLFCLFLLLVGNGLFRLFQSSWKSAAQFSAPPTVPGMVFVGLAVLLHLMNLIQAFEWHIYGLLILVPLLVIGVQPFIQQTKFAWTENKDLMVTLLLIFVCYLLFLKPQVPMLAWDSWLGWEMKAKQWMIHGLSVEMLEANQWKHAVDGIYSAVAHYPDGLPLLYYLFQYLGDQNNCIMSYVYPLMYFYVLWVLLCRTKQNGAGIVLMTLCGILFLSMPLLNNHMNLQGYADMWLAMVMLLSVLALSDWNQNHSLVYLLRLILLLSLLPLFKLEGWVWLLLLVLSQFFSKFLIRRHRIYVVLITVVLVLAWFVTEPWVFSWAGRTIVVSQDYLRLGHWFELTMVPVNVSEEIFTGLFLQNNWGLVWYFLPITLLFWLLFEHPKHQEVTQTFFIFSFAAFLVLFFFTDASKWAENYTAVNRVVLQLTPVFAYLVLQALITWQKRAGKPALDLK